jgi:phosphatidylserine/phosphatidylglycerophosphate/cardiolipin synthase-like enzyme
MAHRLIVLPDDTPQSVVSPIEAARERLNIRMFLFTDPTLLDAAVKAHRRGVYVRVMLNPARRDGSNDNEEARRMLHQAGIEVRDSSKAFALTHQKSMVVDDTIGFVESLNWETRDLTETRDYAVSTTDKVEVGEMVKCFDRDWEQKDFQPRQGCQLIWCPNNGRERITEFVDSAKHSLVIQNERYQDTVVIERLVRAVNRGVKVHIMARPPHKLKPGKLNEGLSGLRIMQDVGAKVHKLKHLKLHGKMLLADGKRAIVGSINLTPGSFDSRRELAIETDASHVIERLVRVTDHDWEHSSKLDLSEAAILASLEKHRPEYSKDAHHGQS